jgi:hypothetical protein
MSGADPGFQVRGGGLKKIAPSGGGREHFWGISLDIFFYRFVMVVCKNVLEYIIALVVVKNKVRLKKCLKKFQI